ncbi:Acg family FMN-binding oxidoreductase [Pseudaestuariivita rosea]|uniref:Acg family FMN-binding oxidoreductase n=1 Tax=Pseudaestuariivita rosea TaxID=2763263 RepID=UPI001ABBB659|nr:twin-arginine translocation pathway signal protein [Pseudaestuariivita rosea]
MNRRKALTLLGGGTIFAAGAAAGGFLATRTPHRALAPWDAAGTYADPRQNALSFALLAPNPHNLQPWLVELVDQDKLMIHLDPDRSLPVTDPFDRQLTIGMGCFIELMEMAAAQDGYAVETVLYPEGETGPVAHCTFVANAAEPDPLFAHVMNRRSHKEAFEERQVPAGMAATLAKYANIATDADEVATLGRIANEAWLIEATTPAAFQESVDLLRIGKSEINANPDGIDLGGPMFDTLALFGMLTREAASDPNNPGSQRAINDTSAAILGAPAFVVQTTPTNTRLDQIKAGRDWLRLNLETTSLGLALRPVSQALQEYPEVSGPFDEVHQLYAPNGETVQMLGLLGYGAPVPRTPRWPLETKLMNA